VIFHKSKFAPPGDNKGVVLFDASGVPVMAGVRVGVGVAVGVGHPVGIECGSGV
jgi:hypothetical protein